jgi:hypothetical protein
MPSAAAEAPPAYSYGPDTTVIGAVSDCTVSPGESLIEIARRHGLGYNEITTANPGKDPLCLREGRESPSPPWILPDLKTTMASSSTTLPR